MKLLTSVEEEEYLEKKEKYWKHLLYKIDWSHDFSILKCSLLYRVTSLRKATYELPEFPYLHLLSLPSQGLYKHFQQIWLEQLALHSTSKDLTLSCLKKIETRVYDQTNRTNRTCLGTSLTKISIQQGKPGKEDDVLYYYGDGSYSSFRRRFDDQTLFMYRLLKLLCEDTDEQLAKLYLERECFDETITRR